MVQSGRLSKDGLRDTTRIMTENEWIALAYREGKVDMARHLVEEVNQIGIQGTDEYVKGANFAIVEVLKVIEQSLGGLDDKR